MHKLITITTLLITICLFKIIFNEPTILFNNITDTLYLWLTNVVPSIFIFYCLSCAIISTGLIYYIVKILKPLNKILGFSSLNAFSLFILSIFLGSPSSSILFVSQYENNNITKKELNVLLLSGSFITPFFIISFFSNNIKIAIFLFISHIISNMIICTILNRKEKKNIVKELNLEKFNFLDMTRKIPYILLTIAYIMCLSSTLIIIINTTFNNKLLQLTSLLEIANGLASIKNIYFQAFLIGFAGFAIHLQVLDISSKYLNYLYFLIVRIIQGICTMILFYLFCLF